MDIQDSTSSFGLVPAYDPPYILESNSELTYEQATKLTESIRNTSKVLWVLISRAHTGKAWLALGYPSWESYVVAEFDISRSRSYQLLNQAKVIQAIESNVPEGTHIVISESEARDLRGVLDEVLPQIESQTKGLSPEEASIVASQILQNQKNTEKEAERENAYHKVDEELESNLDYKSSAFTDFNFADDSDGPAPILPDSPLRLSSILEPYEPTEVPNAVPSMPKIDVAALRRDINTIHDIYSSLSALAEMPVENLEKIINMIPADKYATINNNIDKAVENLHTFAKLWGAKKNAQDNTDENEE